MKKLLLVVSHLLFAAIGFAAGIYLLPILTAPPAAAFTSAAVGALPTSRACSAATSRTATSSTGARAPSR